MKATIEVARKGSAARTARQQSSATRQGRMPDVRLSFESARLRFAELKPARLYDAVEIVLPLAQVA